MKKFRENWKIGIALIIVMLIVAMPVSEVYAQEEILSPEEKREQELEEIGEDIVINVEEYQPKIVRASLLEEQGVNVHALLTGIPNTYTNPTITIPTIQSVSVRPVKITTKPENLKDKVKIGNIRYYAPGRKELFSGFGLEMQGYRQDASFNNLGYLRIPIKAIPKEDDVPEEITIEMDGFVYYYVSEGLGFTQTEMVLNEMSESEWLKQKEQNSFFGGYLRADKIGKDSAEFILYDNSGVAVDRKISVSRGGTSDRLDSYGFFRRLFGNDYSSKKNLFSKFKIRVDEIRGKGPTAEVMIFKDNDFLHRVLKEGDSLYAGSDWYVDRIRERRGTADEGYDGYRISEVTFKSNLAPEKKLKLIAKSVTEKAKTEAATGATQSTPQITEKECDTVKKLDLSKNDFSEEVTKLEACIKVANTKKDAIDKLKQIEARYLFLIIGPQIEKKRLEEEKEKAADDKKESFDGQITEKENIIKKYNEQIERINNLIPPEEREKGAEGVAEVKAISKSRDAYDNAVSAFNKVIVNYPRVEDGKLAANAQAEIADIYAELATTGDPKYQGLAISAIEDLVNNYADKIIGIEGYKELADALKRTSFAYNTEYASDSFSEGDINFDVSLINVNIAREGSIVTLDVDGNLVEKGVLGDLSDIGLEGLVVQEIYENSILITPAEQATNIFFKVGEIFSGTRSVLNIGETYIVSYKIKESGEDDRIIEKKIRVSDIDLKREVKVTLIPEIERAYSRAHFNLHIPIEKRPFKLPLFSDSIDEEINKTQKLINKTQKLIDKLEKLHNYWSKFCLVTFASLTVKNFFFGAKNAASRKEIGGMWRDKYDKSEEKKKGWSYDRYVISERENYGKDLKLANQMFSDTRNMKDADRAYELAKIRAKNWGDRDPTLVSNFINEEFRSVSNGVDEKIKVMGDKNREELVEEATKDGIRVTPFADKYTILEQIRKEELKRAINNQNLLEGNRWTDEFGRERITIPKDLSTYLETIGRDYGVKTAQSGVISSLQITTGSLDDKGVVVYKEPINGKQVDVYTLFLDRNGKLELLYTDNQKSTRLTSANYDQAVISGNLYDSDGKKIEIGQISQERATMKPTLSLVSSGTQTGLIEMMGISAYLYAQVEYTSGGAIKNVYVYKRAKANDMLGKGYRLFELTDVSNENLIATLRREGLESDIDAVNRIRAQIINCNREITQSGFGFRRDVGDWVTCGEHKFLIDNAKAPITASCTDVMDPIDCGIMFNACDPVMCPASRCNLRGNWELGPGESVAETGIIGSVALCLGNAGVPPEGVIMPVCLTGILAGLKNIQSMLVGYRECLKVSKTEGKSVGICDKVRNVAICDILWREALAIFGVKGGLLNFVFSKLGGDKGGGEYTSGMQERLEGTKNAMEYFTQSYAKNVFAKYSGGSLKEIGGEICKAAVYGKGPGVGDFFDQIQKPESPPQFFAVVDEIPMTDITPTPRSMYNVYYHMYAGENEDIRYSVYLKKEDPFTGGGGIIYVLGEGRQISNVNLGAGESEDISADFEASSGYDQVCVRIASTTYGIREECGFGKATSSFAIDRLSDIYTANQATKFIETEEQCTPSVGRVTELSQQGGSVGGVKAAVGTFSTGLTQTGIIRRCSYYNPGVGDDENKWAPVGSCGKDDRGRDLGRCWLYQENIQNLIRHKEVEEAVKKGLKNAEDDLREKGIIEKGVIVAEGNDVIEGVKKGLDRAMDTPSFRSLISQLEKVISEAYDAKGDEDLVVKARAQFTIGLVYKKWGEVLREKELSEKKAAGASGVGQGTVKPASASSSIQEEGQACRLEKVYLTSDKDGKIEYSVTSPIDYLNKDKIYLNIKSSNCKLNYQNNLEIKLYYSNGGREVSWSSVSGVVENEFFNKEDLYILKIEPVLFNEEGYYYFSVSYGESEENKLESDIYPLYNQ